MLSSQFKAALKQSWQRMAVAEKAGLVGLALTLAVDNYVSHTTPVSLWNGPAHLLAQKEVLAAQTFSAVLYILGGFLRLRRELREDDNCSKE